MTGLARPGTAAVSDQLVEVYRAAMSAPPFHETDVETGWFAEELAGQFAVVWIAVRPDRRGRGLGRELLERLLDGAGTERAWLVTHDLDTPARALYRSLGFRELGRGPLGWHDADRVVLGAELPPPGPRIPLPRQG
jgi:ribosomal protein S18 acetylase RimI-like enzyme